MLVPVYARKITESVTPLSTEYPANERVAAVGLIDWIRAERNHTSASSPIIRPKKRPRLVTIDRTSCVFPATYNATTPVIARPSAIHVYTFLSMLRCLSRACDRR